MQRSDEAASPEAPSGATPAGAGAADDPLRARLEAVADGLLFISEGDAPFEFFRLPAPPAEDAAGDDAGGPLTVEEFRAALGVGGDVRVEAVPLDRFFAGHVEDADPADPVMRRQVPRFRALRETLRRELSGVRVFRVGEVEVRAYVAGRAPDGGVAGLATTLYET